MRKILLVSNAHEVKPSAIDFACYIGNLTHSSVTGVFLEHKEELVETSVPAGTEEYKQASSGSISDNTNLFADRCLYNDASYSIFCVKGHPLPEAIKESLYVDIILADGNTSFNEHDGWPSRFVKDLLEHSKCPIVITPFDFDEINEIVFAYDGTDSSIFAMKQFIYLFPEFGETKITLLQVLGREDDDITEKEKLQSLLTTYYSTVYYDTLRGDAGVELFKKFIGQRNKLLVMGAYGRKRFFNRSTADILLKTLNIPIFITHY